MKWALVLVVPAVLGTTARAEGQDVPEGTTIKLLLLRQKSVQKELELTPETVEKIQAFTTKQSEAVRKVLQASDAERRQEYEKLAKENDQFLTETLTPKQSKRLDQIMMQFTALTQLLKPEMVKEFNLTDEQVQKLKDLQKEARKALVDVLYAKDREGRNEKFAKLREETRTRGLAILTDEQKAKVREMAGPVFEGEIVFEEPD
jgi:Spy/CpxP family protein refolding chaperone